MRFSVFQPGAFQVGALGIGLAVMAVVCPLARGAEHVTLKNGFELDCVRREAVGDKVRLYFAGKNADAGEGANYLEVAADAVVRVEAVADSLKAPPSKLEMHVMLEQAGAAHHIDEDLLASLVRAESAGQVRAVSRTGARGLMQLMPGTASAMGVEDSFRADENIAGGTAYLDALLTRYHDNVALALAAYNAGPGVVDKYHGVPPYRETREYVARVIREFNRRKQLSQMAQAR
jgi:soluble lytic murein transglycosylase-like protein